MNYMKVVLFPLFLAIGFSVFFQTAQAQKTGLEINVLDESNGEALIGASVLINGSEEISDINGKIAISAEFPLIVEVTYIGYEKQIKEWKQP